MKFTTAWANVLTQNMTLRASIAVLGVCALVLSISTVKLALRDPLIIERECVSKSRQATSTKHTPVEIDAFVRTALPKRFDSDAADAQVVLSSEENGFRAKEQDELAKRSMSQRVLVNGMKVNGSDVTVDADRLIAVGKIKSVIPFPVTVSLSTTDRTPGNPYGLVIRRVSQIKQEESSK
jgi:hypothetical protein